jgi:hypothetical protein
MGIFWFLSFYVGTLFNPASSAPTQIPLRRLLVSNLKVINLAIFVVVLPEVAVSALARHIEGGEADIPV